MIDLLLLILGLICFALAALRVKSPVELVALGLFFVFLRGLLG
jgi:hypothetical protein